MSETVSFDVDGMTCASCVARVERALTHLPGVRSAAVNLATETARVEINDRTNPTIDAMLAAIARAGYAAKPRASASVAAAGTAPAGSTAMYAGDAPPGYLREREPHRGRGRDAGTGSGSITGRSAGNLAGGSAGSRVGGGSAGRGAAGGCGRDAGAPAVVDPGDEFGAPGRTEDTAA